MAKLRHRVRVLEKTIKDFLDSEEGIEAAKILIQKYKKFGNYDRGRIIESPLGCAIWINKMKMSSFILWSNFTNMFVFLYIYTFFIFILFRRVITHLYF